jgi:hypothetical protein
MRRVLVLSLVALATFVGAAPTAAATGPRHGLYFETHAGGFLVQVKIPLGSRRMRLTLDRHGEVAYYYVRARVDADSVQARFGRLGSLDLSFAPKPGEGAPGCSSGEEGWQRGVFKGAFAFRGEHDYAHVDVHRVAGWMQTYPAECRGGGDKSGMARAVARASAAPTAAETGVLLEAFTAFKPPTSYFYCSIANESGGVRAYFNAFHEERREGMTILRGAQVVGGASTFQWNLGDGTARVQPPAPFSGHASYRREGHHKASWRGSLSVPILGSSRPLRLTGGAFRVHLGRDT